LRDAALAEDMVHDVLTSVIAGQARFGERSSLRTWLTAILKHKIVDAVRRQAGERSLDAMLDGDEPWPDGPALPVVADPCHVAEQRQTLAQVLARLEALPAPLSCAFELRVVLGHSTAEVCDALDITAGNLWVRVHRVRKGLLAA